MNIAVVGTGYVGLVTGTCLAETGNNVVCVDVDEEKVDKLKKGEVPIYEPHLDVFFERNLKQNRLSFTTSLEEGVKDAELIFLALPTPPGEDGSADLSYVLGVADHLGKIIDNYKVIIDKSTVPVGTAEKVKLAISKHATVDFDVVSNPEFLREGFAVNDFMKPDRVVVGCSSEKAKKLMTELYQPFVRQGNPILFMDEKSAELTKYAANSFLATKITFMNEIANYCELIGADVDKVRKGIGTDSRIGKRFLFPGIGYGGSCFPKDVLALKKAGNDVDYEFKIVDAVLNVNHKQKFSLVEKVKSYFGENLSGKTLALWGLAFKPETDDIREAPAITLMELCKAAGATCVAFDPVAAENCAAQHPGLCELSDDMYNTLSGADAVVVSTDWDEFKRPDFARMKENLQTPVIFDGRNLYKMSTARNEGFVLHSVGRQPINA